MIKTSVSPIEPMHYGRCNADDAGEAFFIVNPILSPETTVKELLDRYPRLLQTFMDLGLLCAGCPMEAFHTLSDVAKEHGIDPQTLFDRFHKIIKAAEAAGLPETTKTIKQEKGEPSHE